MDYLAILSRVRPRVWIAPRALSPEFAAASRSEHWRADAEIACWEWDDLYAGHPLD